MERSAADLNIHQLHTFRLVYMHGGFSAAADVAGTSTPTLWHHVRELERVYGTALFTKVGRRVEPTEAARRLYDAVEEILVRLDSTFDLVAEDESAPITIVTGVRMMMEDLAEPLAIFRARYSNAIRIVQGNDRHAEALIGSDQADIALALEPGSGNASPLVHYEPAFSIDFLAVALPDHPFMLAKSSGIHELVKHPLVVTAPGTHGRDALDQALNSRNLTSKIAVETDNSGFTIACAQAGIGLGILAGRPNGRLCQQLATRSLSRLLGKRNIVFMWRKGRRLTDALLGLVEIIQGNV
ncbi:MAG: LysR family transcriptional regulator [Planctomycetota bacterium]